MKRNILGLLLFCGPIQPLLLIPQAVKASSPVDAPDLPFSFVENRGQTDPEVRYIGSGRDFTAWFGDRGVVLRNREAVVRIAFTGQAVATHPKIFGGSLTGGRANYLQGRNPGAWATDLPMMSGIRYQEVWPGIDIEYNADRGHMKAEYRVAPGTSVDSIRLRFDAKAAIERDGSLRIKTVTGDFVEDAPVFYQIIEGQRRPVSGEFRLVEDGSIGFHVLQYDRSSPLIIDPSILFSGYFGGNSQDNITALKIDAANNIVVAGWTTSSDLPTANGARKVRGGSVDAFVASFLPNGGGLIYCTYLGGAGDDRAFGLALDASRNVYVAGWTSSANFPLASPLQPRLSGVRDAFVTKLNPTGNALVYSTYLGGSGVDVAYSVAVDSAGEAVVAGDTTSTNLPATAGAVQAKVRGGQDVFAAKLSVAGNSLVFLTYLGGSGVDHCSVVALGPHGGIVLGGYTWSTDFPAVGAYPAFQSASGGGQDGFVAKLGPTGTTLTFSTYLGGSGGAISAPEEVNSIAVDQTFNIVVVGTTSSSNFPVTGGSFQTTIAGEQDGFVARFGSSGNLLASTYVGGALNDSMNAVAVDFHGNPYVTGSTASLDFPVSSPLQSSNAGGLDAFVIKMNLSLSAITYGTYLGGGDSDGGNAIDVDFETSVVVGGQTSSSNFPASGNLQRLPEESLSSFLTKIAPNFTIGVAYPYQGQQTFVLDPWRVSSYLSSTFYGGSTDIPVVGDWTGSGIKRIGIFRNGVWYLDTNGNGVLDAADKTVTFGQSGDIPVVGDWRGTGRPALGLFRRGTFILDLSGHLTGAPTGLSDATLAFGQAGDLPVAADWNGSGTTKVGVFRNGLWLIDYNGDGVFNGSDRSYVYGQAGDVPVVGDWDSSGTPNKIGIYRGGLWVMDYDGDNAWTTPYVNEMVVGLGFPGYTPLVF